MRGVVGCKIDILVSFDEIKHSPQSSKANVVVEENGGSEFAVDVSDAVVASIVGAAPGSSESSPSTRSVVCSDSG